MRQILRALTLTAVGGFIFAIGAFGWAGLLDSSAAAIPVFQEFATMRFTRSLGILVGLALLLLPFYTLLYFHKTTRAEVLGFKTPNADQKPEQSCPGSGGG